MSRKKGHAEAHPDERWVISYADLVTLLLGFFIILYATADANVAKFIKLSTGLSQAFNVPVKEGAVGGSLLDGGSGLVPSGPQGKIDLDLKAIRDLVQKESTGGLAGKILVSKDDDHITIRLSDNLVFASASADIRDDAKPLLKIVADALRDNKNEVRVEGHTDNIPVVTERYPSNWELSSARATSVLRYLTEQLGVDASRISAAGYGPNKPIANNLTPEGRALNRRADVVILYPPSQIAPVSVTPAAPAVAPKTTTSGASTPGNGAGH
ncbi:MAG: OmpA family protein [Dehalococcoidia bacterium]